MSAIADENNNSNDFLIRFIEEKFDNQNAKFDAKFGKIDEKFDNIDKKFDRIDEEFKELKEDINNKIDSLESDLNSKIVGLETDLDGIKNNHLKHMDTKLTEIKNDQAVRLSAIERDQYWLRLLMIGVLTSMVGIFLKQIFHHDLNLMKHD
ncbi:MAG: hypothetical protein LBR15_05285 [Methanobrevibacter sp.]|jgi:chromosome segregation ATPase|nr:hypothetical protein [Candidatus Methanovirga australis]